VPNPKHKECDQHQNNRSFQFQVRGLERPVTNERSPLCHCTVSLYLEIDRNQQLGEINVSAPSHCICGYSVYRDDHRRSGCIEDSSRISAINHLLYKLTVALQKNE